MKRKGMLYALAIIALDVIAVVSVIKANIDPTEKEYKLAIEQGKKYESQELCDKAIDEYYKACKLIDSEDLRIKIADLYEKGYENGEYSTLNGRNNVLASVIRDYPKNADCYDTLISYYDGIADYSNCAVYIKKAKENEVSTKTIEDCYEKIRRMYSTTNVPYDSIESFGTCMQAKRHMSMEVEERDAKGNVIYEDNGFGDKIPKTKKKEYTEFTYLYDNGTISDTISAIDMSPLASVVTEDGGYYVYFCKNYGNDLITMDKSDEVYSGMVVGGSRNGYVGEKNEYESCGPFSSGFIVLKNTKTGKYELFDKTGKSVTSEPYDFLGCFSNDLIYAEKGGKKIIMDNNAETVFDNIDDVIRKHGERCSISDRMFVKFSGDSKYTLVNSKERTKMDFQCDDADLFLDSAAAFKKDGKWGFVRNDGLVVIDPEYEEARSFSNGFAAVKKDGKWGFINKSQEMIIEPIFEDVMYFSSNGSVYVRTAEDGWVNIKLFYVG